MSDTAEKIQAARHRDIIEIDESLCNGCGQCVTGCAEGALKIIDGKARLVSDIYCDGLGACLGHCPTGALRIIQRLAPEFDEEAAMAQVAKTQAAQEKASTAEAAPLPCGCPGAMARGLGKPIPMAGPKAAAPGPAAAPSQLANWPIQLKLTPPKAPFLDSPVLILAADCTAFAGPAFHQTFLSSGYPLIIACPKLDEAGPYIDKMAEILAAHPAIAELWAPMMSVPCCGGLGYIAAQAIKKAGREGQIKVRVWIVTPEGRLAEEEIR